MSKKEPTVAQELPKSPNEFSYRGNELITITANEFLAIVKANEIAIKQGIETKFKAQPEWVSTVTGAIVTEPTQEDLQSGLVTQVTSIEKTFSADNFQETFAAWLYPDVIQLKEMLLGVHKRQIETGVAVHFETLKAEYASRQAAAQAAGAAEGPQVAPTPETIDVVAEEVAPAKAPRKAKAPGKANLKKV